MAVCALISRRQRQTQISIFPRPQRVALDEVAAWLNFCPKWTRVTVFVHNGKMSSKPPIVFPQEQTLLTALGERLRLARLRRKLSTAVVAQRAGMSRTSVYKVEAGDAGATLGTYLRVLAVLGLQADFNALAADDKVGRKLQDLALAPSPAARRQRRASVLSTDAANSTSEGQP